MYNLGTPSEFLLFMCSAAVEEYKSSAHAAKLEAKFSPLLSVAQGEKFLSNDSSVEQG